MGGHKLTGVPTAVDPTDVASKEYVDKHAPHRPYNLGRYIVQPFGDEKIYFSVRAKKNINLVDDLLVELKNNTADSNENEFNDSGGNITITKNVNLVAADGNRTLGTMTLNSPIMLQFSNNLPRPWSFFFSAKPEANLPSSSNRTQFTFSHPGSRRISLLRVEWSDSFLNYRIIGDTLDPFNMDLDPLNGSTKLDTTRMNHIAIEYTNDQKLCIWVNGKQVKSLSNIELGVIMNLTTLVKHLGILSLYGRHLNRQEIVQHFIDHHVPNFTDDEVLI
jgi:hypothetical protein